MKEEKAMSYDFGKKKIGAGEKQERNRKETGECIVRRCWDRA